MLLALILVYVYFLMVDLMTGTLAASAQEVGVTNALLTGEYASIYWLSLATALSFLIWQSVRNRWSVSLLALAGVLVNVGAMLKRYLIVVPSQIYGTLLPYQVGFYAPSWVEYAVLVGLLGLGALLFALFVKVFPILPVQEISEGGE
ncbi:MAG: hypothetical protein ACE5JE_00920 [Thermoplasmata archaeon]